MTTSSIDHLPTARYRSSDDDRCWPAVLRATLAELDDRGYAAASLRTIADRADIPLETMFTRWRSKQHLVHDAITLLAGDQPTPETGDVRTDLLHVVEALGELLSHPGTAEVLRTMLVTAGDDPAAGIALRIGLLGERRAVVRRIVERGQRRQQFPAAVHPGLVADAIVGALVYRRFVSAEPVDRQTGTQIVDVVLGAHAAA
ncbi:MAG TPA: TetR/AcrR family transcriptional regulator [Euzebyales bacterium]|nr:TetR/AcrR family transcriptional regulator [Euzebyales bacterium]